MTQDIARDQERALLRGRADRLHTALLHVLRSRYTDGGEPYAISEACILLDHPMRWEDDRRPPYKDNRCFCGKVVDHAGLP